MNREKIESVLLNIPMRHIIFEPGDCTKYEFIVFELDDIYHIVTQNTFNTPKNFDRWMLKVGIAEYEKNEIGITELCDKLYPWRTEKINPNTIVQYARAIYKIYK
jgi:hypothetical protein